MQPDFGLVVYLRFATVVVFKVQQMRTHCAAVRDNQQQSRWQITQSNISEELQTENTQHLSRQHETKLK